MGFGLCLHPFLHSKLPLTPFPTDMLLTVVFANKGALTLKQGLIHFYQHLFQRLRPGKGQVVQVVRHLGHAFDFILVSISLLWEWLSGMGWVSSSAHDVEASEGVRYLSKN